MPSLHFSFDAPATHGAVLRQLGAPAAWAGDGSPAEALAPLVRAAAESRPPLALAEADAATTADAPAPAPGPAGIGEVRPAAKKKQMPKQKNEAKRRRATPRATRAAPAPKRRKA